MTTLRQRMMADSPDPQLFPTIPSHADGVIAWGFVAEFCEKVILAIT